MKILFATNIVTRIVGLLPYRQEAEAIYFLLPTCKKVHTFFMRHPIHVIFLDKNVHVLEIQKNLTPWSISRTVPGVDSILEILPGKNDDGLEGLSELLEQIKKNR